MKQLFLFLALVSLLFATPPWYLNVQKTKAHSYVGYGSGVSEAEARQEAFNDITSQISVSVDTSFFQQQKVLGEEVQSTQDFNSLQTSKATLYDYELLKSEFYDGRYFVAIEYENIPSLDKFVQKVKKSPYALKDEKQNSYLKHTLVAKKLKKALDKEIAFTIVRKNQKWFIRYKNILQVLDKRDFAMFFKSVKNPTLSINTNRPKNILYEDDKFFFKVKTSKKGFASIVTVYEDGTVATLLRNVALSENKMHNIPDEEFELIPEAGLMQSGIETYDLYVLLLSNKKIHLDSFAHADSELVDEEKYKNFDELVELLDAKDFATLRVVTKPRMY